MPSSPQRGWRSVGCRHRREGAFSDLPRNETLIVENPEGTIKNAGWFNIWAINAGGQSTGLHQLGDGHLLVHRPAERGIDGVWDNSLASDKPIYNADFTEMTVKLRKGIFWSDGVEFTAGRRRLHDRDPHEAPTGLRWSAPMQVNVAEHRRRPIRTTVVFKLKKPNSRFHALVHRALERDVDDAQARLREGRRSAEVRLSIRRSTLGAYTLNSLRPQRQVVHLAAARRTGSAPRWRASASQGRSTSPTSIPARPTSA